MARFVVIGLGRFGKSLATHLAAGGAEVIAFDADRRAVENIKDEVTMAVTLDATDEHALEAQNLEKVDAAIVCIGESFEANQLATLHLKNIGVKRVVAKAKPQHSATSSNASAPTKSSPLRKKWEPSSPAISSTPWLSKLSRWPRASA